MQPQDFCCIPTCGASFGAPYKRAKIRGVVVEYPSGIDFHHTRGRNNPEGVYICHSCHMKHHDGIEKLDFLDDDTDAPLVLIDGEYTPCRIATGLETA